MSKFKEVWGLDSSIYDKNLFVTAGDDGCVKMWDLKKGQNVIIGFFLANILTRILNR